MKLESESDQELLRAFAETGSEEAFTELVRRHIALVYSAAFRQLNDAHLAQDVAQAVFVLLARKAASLRKGTMLTGWLYRAAQFSANDVIKAEGRRRKREVIAVENAAIEAESRGMGGGPALDRALAGLAEKDRLAILLRFFEEKSLREVGEALGIAEDAARKRIERAVEKLRGLMDQRNGAAVVTLLSEAAQIKLPPGLAIRASTAALAGSSGLSLPLMELVQAGLQAMLLSKIKRILPMFVGAVLLMFLIGEAMHPRAPALTAQEVLERHHAEANTHALAGPAPEDRAGTSCMKCHRGPAAGGSDQLVREVLLEGEWSDPARALSGTFEIRLAGTERVLEEIRIEGLGTWVRGCNGDSGWETGPEKQTRSLEASESQQLRDETTVLLWPGAQSLTKLAESVKFAGAAAYRVEPGGEREFLFEAGNGLLAGVIWRSGAEGTNRLGEYRAFGGLAVPTRIVRRTGRSEEVFQVKSARVADVPESIFEPPQARKNPPDFWPAGLR